ncbi:MAG: AAA family ATPase, partial [Aquificaceae bacterium]|nr:AAA family ATPase [Aquificaceae bacterium]MDW8237937.1 AAA family ATPase [Aquificaceae bacterium]
LQNLSIIGSIEGIGYSVLRISQDGTIYTSGFEKIDEKTTYPIIALSTNLLDFAYGKERLNHIVKNAQQALKAFKQKLKSEPQEPTQLEEYKKLLSLDLPIREVRQLLLEAKTLVQDARIAQVRKKIDFLINSNALRAEDISMISALEKEPLSEEQLSSLKAIRENAISHLLNKLEQKLSEAKSAINSGDFSEQRQIEALEEVKSLREFAQTLPKELRQDSLKELQKAIQERLINSRFERYRIKKEEGLIYFGQEAVKRLDRAQEKLKWKLSFQEQILISDKTYVKIAFERQDGKIVEPRRYPNLLQLSEAPKARFVKSYLRHLNGLMGQRAAPPAPKISFVETPWFVFNLERFAKLANEQLEYKDGVIILEGDAGVGKNFLIEVFCYLTNRPLFIIPCSGKMEREDITFLYEFDPKRGTRRVYSELIRALSTKGAVIYFDEINTLAHSVIKMFNPLFDYRRSISLSTGEVFYAHPEVILTGGMNPQNYLGVSELPQDVKSRADIMFVDYPPFESDGLYIPDEAMIMRLNVPELMNLKNEEFVKLWHSRINNINLGSNFTKEQENRVYELFAILKVASALRKAHRAYQSQQSEEPVQVIFSIRDSMRCARRLGKFKDLRTLLYETISSKASSPLEREIIKNIIDSELNELS